MLTFLSLKKSKAEWKNVNQIMKWVGGINTERNHAEGLGNTATWLYFPSGINPIGQNIVIYI